MSRWKIRAVVKTSRNKDDTDVRYEAVQHMKSIGATEIREFLEVPATTRDRKKADAQNVRVFTATAVKVEASVG